MSDHYYAATPESESHVRTVTIRCRGVERMLWTDNGVFAKRGLDSGSALLIETVELPNRGVVVDLGCGYGPLTAILSVVYPGLSFVMLDINERAVTLARRNTEVYRERITAFASDGFAAVPDLCADAVVLNPPIRAGKAVIYRLFEEARSHLAVAGTLWVVIHKKHGAESAERKLAELGADVRVVERKGGFRVLRCEW
ncbi:class I SAM-dependent methyltransferase [Alicyclobacillus sp. ALC3]|uniref:class I SAM-dependent methyltransferase n=1 Tax=Alicyclobacillus sp. ALC3 TaxID=2796143 RepID=UPI002379A26B|nr:methyltransferase [Alicyclobacillus sp. ALC3]WDL98949.1 class I SAM-dependent methyltransferase [Alicyclobacillus sp. ALC3]